MSLTGTDLVHLRRAVALARQALDRGDEPFGSLLVSEQGEVLFEDHNHVVELEATQHPEFAIARWAGTHLSPQERAASTVYTSGEHCPMCSAAHGWAGLGRIAYAVGSAQLTAWRSGWGGPREPGDGIPHRCPGAGDRRRRARARARGRGASAPCALRRHRPRNRIPDRHRCETASQHEAPRLEWVGSGRDRRRRA